MSNIKYRTNDYGYCGGFVTTFDIANDNDEFIIDGHKFKANSIRLLHGSNGGIKADIDANFISSGNTNFIKPTLYDITRVNFNGPATIVFWKDGTKTVVKCANCDYYDKRTAIMWAIMKKTCGNNSRVKKVLDNLIDNAEASSDENVINFNANPLLRSAVKNFVNSIYGVNANQK